jgi:hypothetical protein
MHLLQLVLVRLLNELLLVVDLVPEIIYMVQQSPDLGILDLNQFLSVFLLSVQQLRIQHLPHFHHLMTLFQELHLLLLEILILLLTILSALLYLIFESVILVQDFIDLLADHFEILLIFSLDMVELPC